MPNVSEFNFNRQTGEVYIEYDDGTGVSKDFTTAVTGVYSKEKGYSTPDKASKATILASGVSGMPSIYCFGSSSTERNHGGASKLCYGYITRFLRKCGGGVRYLGSSGVGGEDSVNQVARLPSVIASLPELPTFFCTPSGRE